MDKPFWAVKRSAGVAPEVRKHASEGILPGFETQGRRHQKSKTGVSVVVPQKELVSSQFFLKKNLVLGQNFRTIIDKRRLTWSVSGPESCITEMLSREPLSVEFRENLSGVRPRQRTPPCHAQPYRHQPSSSN